ncbi:hypothetical protein [Rhizobium sp. KDH_Rht_773_N]
MIEMKDMVTMGLGTIGAVLGVMNTWSAMSQRRVRLRVTPAFLSGPGGEPLGFSIEAINLSSFSLTLCEIGFRTGVNQRMVISSYRTTDGQSLPRRLEPRAAVTFMFALTDFPPASNYRIGPAYVRTACGRIITGDSPARKQFSEMIAEVIGQGRQ